MMTNRRPGDDGPDGFLDAHADRPIPGRNRKPSNRRRPRAKKSRMGLWMALIMLLLIAAFAGALELSRPHVTGDRIGLSDYLSLVNKGRVKDARLLDVDSYITGHYLRDDGVVAQYNTPMPSGSQTGVYFQFLYPQNVPTVVDQQTRKRLATYAVTVLPGLMLILLFVYLILSYRRKSGLFSIGSGAHKVKAEDTNVRFSDIAGQAGAVTELQEIGGYLTDPDRVAALGATVPKGVLIYGPPGSGKTMLAKALATETGVSFYSISGSDFVELYVGVGASRVRQLFKEARENAPAIVFVDELDSIGYARGSLATHSEHDQALNQSLAEMDGFSTSDGILVVAATNRPDVLDQALLRPGRFDRTIGVERPNEEARLAILSVHATGKALGPDIDLGAIARKAVGLTGADLANIMNEGALLAARAGRDQITQAELDEALRRTLKAPERQKRLALRERSIGRRFSETDEDRVTFADVAGQEAAVAELAEIKEFLLEPERYTSLGAQIPRGVLLYGPPGCGKTMLAKALATEADAAFISVSASEFIEVLVGRGAARVRDLFAEAKGMTPAIVFIDELDAIGRSRATGGGASGMAHGHDEQDQTLNQLLTEMDGFSAGDGIVVLGATNRPGLLDPALLRPGRFDRTVGLGTPDEEGRSKILAAHAKGKALDPDVDLGAIARRGIGLTGADLANITNEAALLAGRAAQSSITQANLEEALTRTLKAPESQRRLSLRDRSIGRRFSETDSNRVTFADVAGQDEAVAELSEIKDFLVAPERYTAVGATIPRGVLLYGPPGCGKTMLAKALAAEANAAFIAVSASEFVEVFVGQGASRVRDLFAEAKSMPPAIIFVDELDALGGARGGVGRTQSHGEREQTLNQLLTEMDGFAPSDGIMVLGATNRSDTLDPALLRPGRFDRTIGLALPDEAARLAILRIHAKGKVLAGRDRDSRSGADTGGSDSASNDVGVDLASLAQRAIGLTGADLASVMNEGALLAARAGGAEITQTHLDESLRRLLGAPERQRRLSMRGRSVGRRAASADEKRVTFADVAGVGEALEELAEVREYLADPGRFAALGARPPRGILLSGPPGCGKTLLARAVAGEANAAFLSVAATEFVEVWVGEGAARVRDLFAEAKSMAPSIVFIDEIDAVGALRALGPAGHREHDQTLNQILVELDGFEATTAVTVLAATNRPDILAPALVRPGRFDRKIDIALPDRAGRRSILAIHARGKPLGVDVDLDTLAGLTRGFAGADLANLLNDAALLATRRNLVTIPMALMDDAVDRATIGLSTKGLLLTESERRIIAYHEAGHALVARALPHATPPHKLTIAARGGTLGHSTHVDTHDRVMATRSMMIDDMATGLGGQIAEELAFGEWGSGCEGDLTVVEDIARRMVCQYGMSALGASAQARAATRYSEETTRAMDAEIRALIEEAAGRARAALTGTGRPALDRVAAALLERETISAVELDAYADGKTPPLPGSGPTDGAGLAAADATARS